MNPLSEKFRREATQNVMQNIASLRNQKDMQSFLARDDDDALVGDRVTLAQSDAAKKSTAPSTDVARQASAAAEGTTADKAELSSNATGTHATAGDATDTRSLQAQGSNGAANADVISTKGADAGTEMEALFAAAGSGLLEENEPGLKRRKSQEARRLAHQDVPEAVLRASREIVEGQIHPVKGPHSSLREMKDVPDVGAMEIAPAGFASAMDISDDVTPLVQEES